MSTYTAPTDLPIDKFADLPERRGERWALRMAGVALMAILAGAGIMYFVHPGFVASQDRNQCAGVSSDLAAVNSLRQAHQYQAALSLLRIVSAEHPAQLCRQNVSMRGLSLTLLVDEYQARMALLFERAHRAGDVAGDQQAIAQYRANEAFAAANRIPKGDRTALSQAEGIAYGLGYFPLSAYIWMQEWRLGRNHSLPAINHYYSTEVNIALELADSRSHRTVTQAQRTLQTARMIGLRFHLARGEATVNLQRLVGPNPASWPPPFPSPLLKGR